MHHGGAERLNCAKSNRKRTQAHRQEGWEAQEVATTGITRRVKSDTLRHLRESAVLTQQELADKAGVSRVTISNYERGEGRPPNALCIRKIATALGADPRDLVTITFE